MTSNCGRHARQSGESRALKSVLRNHAEGYALLCFHYPGTLMLLCMTWQTEMLIQHGSFINVRWLHVHVQRAERDPFQSRAQTSAEDF